MIDVALCFLGQNQQTVNKVQGSQHKMAKKSKNTLFIYLFVLTDFKTMKIWTVVYKTS